MNNDALKYISIINVYFRNSHQVIVIIVDKFYYLHTVFRKRLINLFAMGP